MSPTKRTYVLSFFFNEGAVMCSLSTIHSTVIPIAVSDQYVVLKVQQDSCSCRILAITLGSTTSRRTVKAGRPNLREGF